MTEILKQKDVKAAQYLYNKIDKSKETFLELLDNILDLTTYIPVCVAEYGCDAFGSFDVNGLILDKINILLGVYGIKIDKLS